jgi:hypothetical protein
MSDSLGWRLHYERNARSLLDIPWESGADATPAELAAIARSLQEFQAGERSEGRHLIHLARDYATRSGDADYLLAIRLFIAEEQRHARDLGRFLTLNGIPLLETTFTDTVFRRLRNLVPSLEVSIGVLITAEIIAKVYYAVLREATQSAVLRRLCDQILRDELFHVEFQAQQLARLRAGRSRAAAAVTRAAQRLLYAGTVLVVWLLHRPAIRRGGLTALQWWTSCWREFDAASGELVQRYQPSSERLDGRLCAVFDFQLGKQVADVGLDGLLADGEGQADVAVRAAEAEQAQHVELTGGQFGARR